jgi:NADH-quinone oxidoreductase subunit J
MTFIQFIFYVFAVMAIASAGVVVFSNNPVRSALALVLTFFASAGIWLITQAEFLALILILVYVGAVMTLFLFVIMMLDINIVTQNKRILRYLPFALLVVALLVTLMVVALQPEHIAFAHLAQARLHDMAYSSVGRLGSVLYTIFVYPLELAAVLLLVAIVSAISLSHRPPHNCKTQNPTDQMRVRASDRISIVKMKSEKQED